MVVLGMMVFCLLGLAEVSSGGGKGGGSEVEEGLLRLLGLPRRPSPATNPPEIPKAMLQLYESHSGLQTPNLPLPGRHINSANTARSYYHIEPERRSGRKRREDRMRLVFNVSIPEGERLTGAEVRLEGGVEGGGRVSVHDIVRPGLRGKYPPLLRLIDTKEEEESTTSVALDVLPAIERWSKEKEGNHGLLVEVERSERGRRWLEGLSTSPLLIVYTDDGRNKAPDLETMLSRRPKRAASPSSHHHHHHHSQPKKRWKEGRDHCRRHPLYVDFADVGWNDWIVAPPGYEAYYCHGDCPFPLSDHMNSTNHAVIQNLVHNVNRGAVPKACCVPTQLSSISMLYLDEGGKVVLKTYQDMAVVGCGCR